MHLHEGLPIVTVYRAIEGSIAQGVGWNMIEVDTARRTGRLSAAQADTLEELRLGVSARASKDLDAAFRARSEDMLDALDRALAEDWSGFQLQGTEAQPIGTSHAQRMDIRLRAKHAWPPRVTVYPVWVRGFGAMATELGFYTTDVEVAADALRAFIADIDSAA